jgi:hypothetical protein
MLILTEKAFLRPISGLPNRLFAGCLQVKFRFGGHCNAVFKPENNPQTLPDSCLPKAAISEISPFTVQSSASHLHLFEPGNVKQ